MTGGRVVWDGRWVGRHGIARHAHEVAKRLDGSCEILRPGRVSPTSPIDALYLRGTLRLGRGDLFATPGFNASLPGPFTQLVTVHDLIHLRVENETSRMKKLYYDRVVLPAILSAQRVLTVSQFSRNDLIEWTGLAAEDVVVVGNGCSFPAATSAEIERGAAVEPTTILFVGNPKPHKNLALLVAALRHMSQHIRVVTVGVPLKFVATLCEDHGIAISRFDVRENITETEMRDLYVTASCVALPSTYEGFGFAALEGMAVGTPTAYVCEAVREVVGSLGFCSANATDSVSYAEALTEALAMDASGRQRLIARAMTFSWDESAKLVQQQITEMRSRPRLEN